jgi:hypothetical protein
MSLIEQIRTKIAKGGFEFSQHALDQSIVAATRRARWSRLLPFPYPQEGKMNAHWSDERLVKRLVTYTLELDGQLILVEHAPARVNEETGERFFAPGTMERLQQIVWEQRTPRRVVETPVFEFAASQRPAVAGPLAVELSASDFGTGSLQRTGYAWPGKWFTASVGLIR